MLQGPRVVLNSHHCSRFSQSRLAGKGLIYIHSQHHFLPRTVHLYELLHFVDRHDTR